MFKFLLISFLIFYIVYKLSGFLLRLFVVKTVNNASRQYEQHHTQKTYGKPKDGNVRIDHIPDPNRIKTDRSNGEYVDFEEVK